MPTDLRSEYLAQSVLNATPAMLVTMLYDRLLLDISRARKAIEAGDKAGCNAAALHAQDIVTELMTTLDVTAWAGAQNLLNLYSYLSTELVKANVNQDDARFDACRGLIEPLREAWHTAARELSAEQAAPIPPAVVGPRGELGVG